MTLAYSFIDDEVPTVLPFDQAQPKTNVKKVPPLFNPQENTECNYVVMFFIVGVLMVALGDIMKN